jgi:hypothetical protein
VVYTSSKRDNSKWIKDGGELVRPKGGTSKEPQAPANPNPCPLIDVSGDGIGVQVMF